MDIQTISTIVGALCLAFAATGAFLLAPDRELTQRERIGTYTIFWSFVLYAIFNIYRVIGNEPGIAKYFYMSFPVLLGLLLTLLSEISAKRPPINVTDVRLEKIVNRTWDRLPNNVRRALQSTIISVNSIPEWSPLDREEFKPSSINAARLSPILPFPARGIIHISESDCKDLPDDVIAASLASEMANAYQATKTPFDSEAVDKAGDTLPARWGFKKEMDLLKTRR